MTKHRKILAALAAASLFMGTVSAMGRPVAIEDQGSFMAGGRTTGGCG